MGLDSVELILGWEEAFGIPITDGEAEAMFTTRQIVDGIFQKVRSNLLEDRGCLSMRAFFRLRKAFEEEGIPRHKVRPEVKVSSLLPGRRRRDMLSEVSQRAGLQPLPRMPFGLQFTFGRVRDMVTDAVIQQHKTLRLAGHGWSRAQVREVVRAVMFTQLLLRKFSDDAEIVKDLGVDK